MENTIKDVTGASDESFQSGGFPIPFSIESLRSDILTLYFQQVRTMGWMAGPEAVWKLIERKDDVHEYVVFDPDTTPEEIGFEYGSISNTSFAMSIEHMYQYAYHGILDDSFEPLDNESIHMWVSAILSDMASSRVGDEWESYGATAIAPAARCLEVAELANARRVLEGNNENIFYFSGKGRDDAVGVDGLTVRQMALLAGMEEMSIRAAANPKRANPLQTYSEEGRTRISIDAAKSWLISKGRYVPIQRKFGAGDIDLTKRRFSSIDDLVGTVDARLQMMSRRDNSHEILGETLSSAGILNGRNNHSELNIEAMKNPDQVNLLAELLEFEPRLFSIRVREALANEELSQIERELRDLA